QLAALGLAHLDVRDEAAHRRRRILARAIAALEQLHPRRDAAAVVVDVGEVTVGIRGGIGAPRNPVHAVVGPQRLPLGVAALVGQPPSRYRKSTTAWCSDSEITGLCAR